MTTTMRVKCDDIRRKFSNHEALIARLHQVRDWLKNFDEEAYAKIRNLDDDGLCSAALAAYHDAVWRTGNPECGERSGGLVGVGNDMYWLKGNAPRLSIGEDVVYEGKVYSYQGGEDRSMGNVWTCEIA